MRGRRFEIDQSLTLRYPDQKRDDALLRRGHVFETVAGSRPPGGHPSEPIELAFRIGRDLPIALGQKATAIEDDETGRALLPGISQHLFDRILTPARCFWSDSLPVTRPRGKVGVGVDILVVASRRGDRAESEKRTDSNSTECGTSSI